MGEQLENLAATIVLSILIIVYIYLLLFSKNQIVPHRKYIIPSDTTEDFEKILKLRTDLSMDYSNERFEVARGNDDFFLKDQTLDNGPITPSEKYICSEGFSTIRAESSIIFIFLLHTI